MSELHGGLRAIRESLLKTAEVCSAMPNNEKNEEFRNKMVDTVKSMIEMDAQTQQIQKIFESLQEKVVKREEIFEHKELKDMWDKKKEKLESVKGENEEKFKRLIEEIINGEDEMEVMNIQYSKKDPISKKDIKKPVKADKCNHVYDLDSITEFAGTKRIINCAMQGCKAKVTIAKLNEFPEFFDLCGDK